MIYEPIYVGVEKFVAFDPDRNRHHEPPLVVESDGDQFWWGAMLLIGNLIGLMSGYLIWS